MMRVRGIEINLESSKTVYTNRRKDLIINIELEQELLLESQLNRSDYLGTNIFNMANNQKVEAQMVKLSEVKI